MGKDQKTRILYGLKKAGNLMYTPKEIADWFITRNNAELREHPYAEKLIPAKIAKLLYYAQAATLVCLDKPLFNNDIIKIKQGVQIKNLHINLKFTNSALTNYRFISKNYDVLSILNSIYDIYARHSAYDLQKHLETEMPYINAKLNEVITLSALQNYYQNIFINCL